MSLSVGDKLGPYEIISRIGKGGMGEVYRAHDTRLRRDVAIKISAAKFSQRFEREARAIAGLNHPHICSIYDVGPDFLVMEHVDGAPLQGPLPLDQALLYASQICDALEAAHRKGIIHRDLKPGNILVGENGVKVLDFGLAKIERAPSPDGATETMPLTSEGSFMGTLPYMAPEQIEGKEVDARADIFAFGVVLYELISGKRPFTGSSQPSLIASILKEQPRPLQELQPLASPGLERVIQTCLEKEPDKRWQSAREVKHALEWVSQGVPDAARTEAPANNLRLWQGIAALMTLIALGLAGWMFWPKTEPATHAITLEAPLPENATLGYYISLSPDGRKLVFAGAGNQDVLRIRDLDTLEWRQLPGTQGGGSPFWSPDSRFLAFGAGNQLKKIDVAGGPPQTLCTVPTDAAGSGTWNRDGVIVFGSTGGGSGGPLWKISQEGGAATAITEVDASRGESYHSLPSFMPDGKHFIYFRSGAPEVEGVYAGSLNAKPGEQSRERILAGRFGASYVNGYLFFMRENTLMAQPFDAGRLQMRAEPVPMAGRVDTTWYNTGIFSVSPSGALAYRATAQSGSFQLTWLDRQGKTLNTVGQPSSDQGIWLSPDGTRGVVRETRGESTGDIWTGRSTGNLWTIDLARGLRTRLTFRQSAGSYQSVWSPDGSRIAFAAGNLLDTLYEKASSGAGDEKELLKGAREDSRSHQLVWRRTVFAVLHSKYAQDRVRCVAPAASGRSQASALAGRRLQRVGCPLLARHALGRLRFHRDRRRRSVCPPVHGRGAGRRALVRRGQVAGIAGRRKLAKVAGGRQGDHLYVRKILVFRAMMAVEVKTNGAAFESGVPQRLFEGPVNNGWDVTPDGQRFLLAASQIRQTGQIPITVVLDWRAGLKK